MFLKALGLYSKNRHFFQCGLLQLCSGFVFYSFLCLLLLWALWSCWGSHCSSVSLGVFTCKVEKCRHPSKFLSSQSVFFAEGSHCVCDACDHFLHHEPHSGPQTTLSNCLLSPAPQIQYLQVKLIIISNLVLFQTSLSCSETTFSLVMRARSLGSLPGTSLSFTIPISCGFPVLNFSQSITFVFLLPPPQSILL